MDKVLNKLNERDDVARTEYNHVNEDGHRVKLELWHDTDGLQNIAQKGMSQNNSARAVREYAEEQALIVRETRVENPPLKSLYPDIINQLKEESSKNEDYEYKVSE